MHSVLPGLRAARGLCRWPGRQTDRLSFGVQGWGADRPQPSKAEIPAVPPDLLTSLRQVVQFVWWTGFCGKCHLISAIPSVELRVGSGGMTGAFSSDNVCVSSSD